MLRTEALDGLQLIADRQHVEIQTDLNAATVLGNAALLERLASKLIHNAIAHNAPADGVKRVFVQVAVRNATALLRVVNTGAVLEPAVGATLTEPFARGERTAATYDAHSGAGLGLALSDTIVRVHGGSLVLHARAEGGLDITAHFALHRPPPNPRNRAPFRGPHRGSGAFSARQRPLRTIRCDRRDWSYRSGRLCVRTDLSRA